MSTFGDSLHYLTFLNSKHGLNSDIGESRETTRAENRTADESHQTGFHFQKPPNCEPTGDAASTKERNGRSAGQSEVRTGLQLGAIGALKRISRTTKPRCIRVSGRYHYENRDTK